MIQAPKVENLPNLFEKKHRSYRRNSSTSHNSFDSHHRFSAYAPSIEEQLNSLVIENNQNQHEETFELLKHDFEQSSDTDHYYMPSISLNDSPVRNSLSSLAHISYGSDKADTESRDVSFSNRSYLFDDQNSMQVPSQDFSGFPALFLKNPVIVGKHLDYYIPLPTRARNYLDQPDPAILKSMNLPYPYRIKEPRTQRLDRLDANNELTKAFNVKNSSLLNINKKINDKGPIASPRRPIPRPIKKSLERHSLALGQVDQLLKRNSDRLLNSLFIEPIPSYETRSWNNRYKRTQQESRKNPSPLPSRTVQSILKWIPDRDSALQDNNDNDYLQMVEMSSKPVNDKQKRSLHPLEHTS